MLVHDDFHGYPTHQTLVATFVRKDSRKRPVLEFCDELGRNTASYEHTIERERLQGKVPCFCVINRREEIQCLLGNLGLSLQASLGYFGGWITDLNLFRKPRRFVLLGIASELIDRLEAGTGQDSFIAHVKILGPQITNGAGRFPGRYPGQNPHGLPQMARGGTVGRPKTGHIHPVRCRQRSRLV